MPVGPWSHSIGACSLADKEFSPWFVGLIENEDGTNGEDDQTVCLSVQKDSLNVGFDRYISIDE